MQSLRKIALAIIIALSTLGIIVMVYGSMYRDMDISKALEMLEYIKANNYEYYQKITDENDPSYRQEFYRHYTIYGNRKIILIGLFILIIDLNFALIFLYLEIKDKIKEYRESGKEEETQGEGEETETEKEPPEGEKNQVK